MTNKFSIEDVPTKKEKKTLIDTIQKLIPEPIPGKTPTKEEILEIIRPLIPEAPKTASKAELKKMIVEYIKKHKETPQTLEFSMREDDKGTIITINGVEHIIPRAVYGPKLRNLQQMGDVSLHNPESGQSLVFRDGYWQNEEIAPTPTTPTLQQVTDEGATTTVESTFSGGILTPQIKANTSAGIDFKSNSDTDIGRMGAGGGSNVSWYGNHNFSLATQDTIAGFLGTGKTLSSLPTATYPSLTELSYGKGVTSPIQTQLDSKGVGTVTGTTNTTLTLTGTTLGTNLANANTWTALQTKRITTKQDEWQYDASNYANLTVGSTGITVIDAVGTAPEFQFRDKLGIGATHTNNSLFNVFGVGATYAFARTMSNVNVNHGMTSDYPTDVYAVDQMCETTKGGYFMTGIVDTGNENAVQIRGVMGSTTPTSSAIMLRGGKKNGTTTQNTGDAEKMFTFVKNNLDEVIVISGNGNTNIKGNLTLGTAGNKINITEGTNASVGVATLVAGTVTVNTTAVTANSRIFLTRQTTAGTLGASVDVTARTAGTSFTITSNGSILETSTVAWMIIN